MARFGLSGSSNKSSTKAVRSWSRIRLDLNDDDDDSDSSCYSEIVEDDNEDMEEPPHPLGFQNMSVSPWSPIQKNRLCYNDEYPSSADTTNSNGNITDNYMGSEELVLRVSNNSKYLQSFTQTNTLFKHHYRCKSKHKLTNDIHASSSISDDDFSMDHITKLLQKTALLHNQYNNNESNTTHNDKMSKFIQSATQKQIQDQLEISQRLKQYTQQQLQTQQKQTNTLLQIIQKQEQEAQSILKIEQIQLQQLQEQELEEENQRLLARQKLAQEEKEQMESKLQKEQERKKQDEKKRIEDEKRLELSKQLEQERKAEQAKRVQHITTAESTIRQLNEIRSSLEVFDKSKEQIISRRRLQMKKIARGKLNTLSHDTAKIASVSQDVMAAIQLNLQEDAQIQQQMQQQGNNGANLTKEMTLGTRYLIDLIASTVVVRVQAEGFNGTRGDGFPLAHMLAYVSSTSDDFMLFVTAHVFNVCKVSIPTLPSPSKDCTENELMESLGMSKDKNGEYESFDRFLARTEAFVSLMADIMSSKPSNHQLFGGHAGAITWLERFLDLIPPEQSPLPLLTAPVLVSFLTAAGHMLANKYEDKFKPKLETISSDILQRLDVSTIGQPSATRLKKLLSGGFEWFKKTLPPGAVAEYYDIEANTQTLCMPVGESAPAPLSLVPEGSNNFNSNGMGFLNTITDNIPIDGDNNIAIEMTTQSSGDNNTFTFSNNNPSTSTSGFSSFFGNSNSGMGVAENSPFSQNSNSYNFSGTMTMPNNNSFQNSSNTPFGISNNNANNSSNTPFGISNNNANGFNNQMNSNNSNIFGNSNPASHGNSATNGFGNQNTSQFGNVSSINGNSGSFGVSNNNSSMFNSVNNNPFGSSNSTTSNPFSSNVSNPFGNSGNMNNSNSFGNSSNSTATTPFSSFGTSSNSTFTSNNNQNTSNPFGSRTSTSQSSKPPCKFFLQGKCRNGAACRFSHEVSGSNNNTSSSSFGGFGSTVSTNSMSPFSNTNVGSSNSAPSPFGGFSNTVTNSQSPFSNSNNSFQNNGSENNTDTKKLPCKFFSQGRCKFGHNCKYSHSTGNSASAQSPFGASSSIINNPFGGGGFGTSRW